MRLNVNKTYGTVSPPLGEHPENGKPFARSALYDQNNVLFDNKGQPVRYADGSAVYDFSEKSDNDASLDKFDLKDIAVRSDDVVTSEYLKDLESLLDSEPALTAKQFRTKASGFLDSVPRSKKATLNALENLYDEKYTEFEQTGEVDSEDVIEEEPEGQPVGSLGSAVNLVAWAKGEAYPKSAVLKAARETYAVSTSTLHDLLDFMIREGHVSKREARKDLDAG